MNSEIAVDLFVRSVNLRPEAPGRMSFRPKGAAGGVRPASDVSAPADQLSASLKAKIPADFLSSIGLVRVEAQRSQGMYRYATLPGAAIRFELRDVDRFIEFLAESAATEPGNSDEFASSLRIVVADVADRALALVAAGPSAQTKPGILGVVGLMGMNSQFNKALAVFGLDSSRGAITIKELNDHRKHARAYATAKLSGLYEVATDDEPWAPSNWHRDLSNFKALDAQWDEVLCAVMGAAANYKDEYAWEVARLARHQIWAARTDVKLWIADIVKRPTTPEAALAGGVEELLDWALQVEDRFVELSNAFKQIDDGLRMLQSPVIYPAAAEPTLNLS